MGAVNTKCCAAEAPHAEVSGEAETKAVLTEEQSSGPPPKPMWLQDAELHTAKVEEERIKNEAAKAAAEKEAAERAAQENAVDELMAAAPIEQEVQEEVKSAPPIAKEEPKAARDEGKSDDKGAVKKKTRPTAKAKDSAPAKDAAPAESASAPGEGTPQAKASGKAKARASAGGASAAEDLSPAVAAAQAGKEMFYTLKINVIGAKNLRNADDFGESDPFCVVEIPGKKKSRFQTKVINENASPTWNEALLLSGFGVNDKLRFEVWDKDTFSANDLLGRVEMTKSQIIPNGFKGDLHLRETDNGKAVSVKSTLQVEVEMTSSVAATPATAPVGVKKLAEGKEQKSDAPTVMVTFISAKGLRNADVGINGLSDPYCICEIPGKESSRIKTPVVKDNLDPVWNHTAQLNDYENNDSLSFVILDKDFGKTDDVLGRARLTKEQIRKGFNGDLQLLDAGKGVKATLKVKVEITGGKVGALGIQAAPAAPTGAAASGSKKAK